MGGCLPQLHNHPCISLWQKDLRSSYCSGQILQLHLQALNAVQLARNCLLDSDRGPYIYCCSTPYRPVKVSHTKKVSGQVLHPQNNKRDERSAGGVDGNKKNRLRFPSPFSYLAKRISGLNNSALTCKLFVRKSSCS